MAARGIPNLSRLGSTLEDAAVPSTSDCLFRVSSAPGAGGGGGGGGVLASSPENIIQAAAARVNPSDHITRKLQHVLTVTAEALRARSAPGNKTASYRGVLELTAAR
jgi:hypothetical protein